MIGNDVVNLVASRAESNCDRHGFVGKLFTDNEKSLINFSENKSLMIWRLWSIKEAAYKIWNRKTGIRAFNPKFFECVLNKNATAQVVFDGNICFARSAITDKYIHSIVVENFLDFNKVIILEDRTNIIKINNLPFYIDNKNIQNPNVSISNHGNLEKIVVLKP